MTLPGDVYAGLVACYPDAVTPHESATEALAALANASAEEAANRAAAAEDAAEAAVAAEAEAADTDVMQSQSQSQSQDSSQASAEVARQEGIVVVHDIMTTLEPANAERGLMTKETIAQFTASNGREPTKEEREGGACQTWADYCAKRMSRVWSVLSLPIVRVYVVAFDRYTHDMKHVEHALRYGKEQQKAAEARIDAAMEKEAAAAGEVPFMAEVPEEIEEEAEAASAPPTDEEVDAAFDATTIPREWRRFRSSRYFTRRLAQLIANGVQALIASAPPVRVNGRLVSKHLVIAGDPRLPLERSHVGRRFRQRRDPATGQIVVVEDALAADSLVANYAEADFSVVMFANEYARLGHDVAVRAIDGDTLLSLLLCTPRVIDAPGRIAMLREMPTSTVCVHIRRLYDAVSTDARLRQGGAASPVEMFVMLCMLSGNDYALNVLPGAYTHRAWLLLRPTKGVRFKRFHKFFVERAASFASLVTATPHRDLALAERQDEPHTIAVDHATFRRFVHEVSEAYKVKEVKRLGAAHLDVAWAILNYTLNYFANAPNALVVQESCFKRVGASVDSDGRVGISLHGFELVRPTETVSRTNVRHAERVWTPL